MRGQLKHLVDVAGRDNVEILVLPTAVGRHDGLEGRFTVLKFLDADGDQRAQSVGYVEIPDDAVYVQDQRQVAKYTGSAELLRSVALSQSASVKAIKARLAALGWSRKERSMDPAPRSQGWKTSSLSSNGTSCVQVSWRTASFSSNGSSCVQVAGSCRAVGLQEP